jgi:hypothetical protein
MSTTTMRKTALTVLALGAASATVVFGSWAAWTASTSNPGNSVKTGKLGLTTDHPATFVFQATNVKPGASDSKTVTVENTDSLPLDLKLSQANAVNGGISSALGLQVFDGTNCVYPAATGACTAYGTWVAGAPLTNKAVGSLAAGATKTFTIGWKLDSSSVDGDQDKTATFDLNWTGTPS